MKKNIKYKFKTMKFNGVYKTRQRLLSVTCFNRRGQCKNVSINWYQIVGLS